MKYNIKKKIKLNKFKKQLLLKKQKSLNLKKNIKENFAYNTSFVAKKSFGQNFLKSKEALNKMSEVGEISNTDTIIEIGPGKGALTEKLLIKAKKVIAIEKDRDLIEPLSIKFSDEIKKNKLLLLNEDILYFDPKKYGLRGGNYKIIANIPYNITGAIIRRFLSEVLKPEKMVLLVQYEVAKRICVNLKDLPKKKGKESILSLSVKAYGTPKYIKKVNKKYFSPSPKVDSAIISINNISGNNFKNKKSEISFFKLIKSGFAHKRKVLRKNLESIEENSNKIMTIFEKLKIDPKTRAEDVLFKKWLLINHYISGKN